MAALSEVCSTMLGHVSDDQSNAFYGGALMSTDTTFGQLQLRWVTTSGLRGQPLGRWTKLRKRFRGDATASSPGQQPPRASLHSRSFHIDFGLRVSLKTYA
jgi:hypothetical protein